MALDFDYMNRELQKLKEACARVRDLQPETSEIRKHCDAGVALVQNVQDVSAGSITTHTLSRHSSQSNAAMKESRDFIDLKRDVSFFGHSVKAATKTASSNFVAANTETNNVASVGNSNG